MTEAATNDRVLVLEGIHNFRDYGGYQADGGRLKRGVLWRSGHHRDATEADLSKVDALGIETVFDLRGNSERDNHPCRRSPEFNAEVIYFDGETASGVAPHEEAAKGDGPEEGAHRRMRWVYSTIPFRPNLNTVLRQYYEILATRDAPSLVHCFAGKDRTGLAVWVLHRLLGVHPDDAMEDYLLTNTAGNNEARIEAAIAALRATGEEVDERRMRIVMGVAPEYLETAVNGLLDRYGTVEAYANAELDVDKAKVERLRAMLVE
ncbi:tyrosine-protein phosphatase [Tsuneonella mangrovi]|uniref:tyrosine-protein phosphatase n=1 Tax=Tsuneonella mangrovi TaxID=1982042 RepID=UPI000BA2B466|nr:tyrosine-protein phosphatase [Tsuneonella mangrovi]